MQPGATKEPQPGFTIREITTSDAEAAASLCAELGYSVTPAVMAERIRRLANSPDHTVFVGCIGDRVVGWIDIGEVVRIQSELAGEIGGFVVSDGFRSTGIGRQLLRRAEEWARERGIGKIVVRSQIKREAAHRFYLREGYQQVKTSHVFSKTLQTI